MKVKSKGAGMISMMSLGLKLPCIRMVTTAGIVLYK